MKAEDVKIGMKVVPFQRTIGRRYDSFYYSKENFKHALKHKNELYSITCLQEKGYTYVKHIYRDKTVLLSYLDSPMHVGNTYNPEDFIQYVESENKQYIMEFK